MSGYRHIPNVGPIRKEDLAFPPYREIYISDELGCKVPFETWLEEPFVIVCGAPRSGTSLACELVKTCGYAFGKKVTAKQHNKAPYNGYNEAGISHECWTKDDRKSQVEQSVKKMWENDSTAAKKLSEFNSWVPFLAEAMPNLRVVVTSRGMESGLLSNVLFVHTYYPKNTKQCLQGAIVFALSSQWSVDLIANSNVNTYELPYDMVARKDADLLSGLKDFIEKPSVDVAAMQGVITKSASEDLEGLADEWMPDWSRE
tara:strand:- start:65 stop:838 length:774 start_codon:yes stop_codon:yes gene_type:complete